MPSSFIVAIDRLGVIRLKKANDGGQTHRDYNEVSQAFRCLLPAFAERLKTSLRLHSLLGNGSDVWGTNVMLAEVTLCPRSSPVFPN